MADRLPGDSGVPAVRSVQRVAVDTGTGDAVAQFDGEWVVGRF